MDGYFLYITEKLDRIRRPKSPRGLKAEVCSTNLWKACAAEFLGTFMFLLVGCASVTHWKGFASDEIPSTVKISFAFGLAITGVIETLGPVSGAHLNPAVSLAFAISRHISPIRAVCYSLAQCAGAVTSSAVLYSLTPDEFRGSLGGNVPNPRLPVASALFVEILFTFFLMMVIYGTTNSQRGNVGHPALIIGLTVATLQLGGMSYSSTSMNPARSLGPAVFANLWDKHWLFWVGPLLGGSLAAIVYCYIIRPYKAGMTMEEAIQKLETDTEREATQLHTKTHTVPFMNGIEQDQSETHIISPL